MSWTAKPAVRTKVYHKPYILQLVRNHPSRLIPLKTPPPKAQCSVNKVNAIATIFSPTPESIICLQINNLVPPASLPHYAVLEYNSLLPTPLQALHGYPTSLVKLQPGDRPINRTQTNSRPHAQIELLLDSQYQYVLEYSSIWWIPTCPIRNISLCPARKQNLGMVSHHCVFIG